MDRADRSTSLDVNDQDAHTRMSLCLVSAPELRVGLIYFLCAVAEASGTKSSQYASRQGSQIVAPTKRQPNAHIGQPPMLPSSVFLCLCSVVWAHILVRRRAQCRRNDSRCKPRWVDNNLRCERISNQMDLARMASLPA